MTRFPRRGLRRLPVCETVAGWARLMGLSSYKTWELVRGLEQRDGVALVRPRGRMRVVYLCDWRKLDPDLFESLKLARELNANDDEPDTDEAA